MSLGMISLAPIAVLLAYLSWRVVRKVGRSAGPVPRRHRRVDSPSSPGYGAGAGTDAGTAGFFGGLGADQGGGAFCDSGGFSDGGGGCDSGGGD